jgi:hypothetical protein
MEKVKPNLLESFFIAVALSGLAWYLYTGTDIQYRERTMSGNSGKVISSLKVTNKEVSYVLGTINANNLVSYGEIVRFSNCDYLDSKNWDCKTFSLDQDRKLFYPIQGLKMLGGKLMLPDTLELDRYLVFSWFGLSIKI